MARAIYRDAAHSSRECFQKTNGLRWLSLHLLVPIHWTGRVWALPFLTALCPSERYAPYASKGRTHKLLVQRARGLIGQAVRWLSAVHSRSWRIVAYAALELLAWCQRLPAPVTLITRLRLDAALYKTAPARTVGQKERARHKGKRLPTLADDFPGQTRFGGGCACAGPRCHRDTQCWLGMHFADYDSICCSVV